MVRYLLVLSLLACAATDLVLARGASSRIAYEKFQHALSANLPHARARSLVNMKQSAAASSSMLASSPTPGNDTESRCHLIQETAYDEMDCRPYETIVMNGRDVLYQVPLGTPPAQGWPVMLMFQGSFFSASITWDASTLEPFGAFYQTTIVKNLLDAGYAVITPKASGDGDLFWDTNIPPYDIDWEGCPDDILMKEILSGIKNGTFGHLDATHKHASGISSGGYMTSRMAISYPGEFLSLVVESASYCICGGPVCVVPSLPSNHPPTLFLHGLLDPIVPIWTMELYYDQMVKQGLPTSKVIDPTGTHQWIPRSPTALMSWVEKYNIASATSVVINK